jgi:MFS transporter, DHA1 family, multidrug resistance protein
LGMCLLGALSLVAVSLAISPSPYLITGSMILYAMGFAVCYPVIFSASLEIFPIIKGTASAAIMSMRALWIALLVGLTGFVYDGRPLSLSFVLFGTVLTALTFMPNLLRSESFACPLQKAA